jgi:hypothetical protein
MSWMVKGLEFQYQWGKEFSLFRIIQNGSGAHLSYKMGTSLSPGVKGQGREADHSRPTMDLYIRSPYIFMA